MKIGAVKNILKETKFCLYFIYLYILLVFYIFIYFFNQGGIKCDTEDVDTLNSV